MVRLGITLPNFDAEFNKNIKKEINAKIAKSMSSIVNKIEQRLGVEIRKSIEGSIVWQEVVGGTLRGELGISNVSNLDAILETWSKSIKVVYSKNKGFGKISIGVIQSDYSDVLSLAESSFTYASNRGSGVIEWLRWLLLESTSIIVSEYDFVSSNQGRTGQGIMVKRQGGGWSVPPQYAGTAADNFVTRSLLDIENTIERVVTGEVQKGVK